MEEESIPLVDLATEEDEEEDAEEVLEDEEEEVEDEEQDQLEEEQEEDGPGPDPEEPAVTWIYQPPSVQSSTQIPRLILKYVKRTILLTHAHISFALQAGSRRSLGDHLPDDRLRAVGLLDLRAPPQSLRPPLHRQPRQSPSPRPRYKRFSANFTIQ